MERSIGMSAEIPHAALSLLSSGSCHEAFSRKSGFDFVCAILSYTSILQLRTTDSHLPETCVGEGYLHNMTGSWDWSGSSSNVAKSPAKSAPASGDNNMKTNDELVEISRSPNRASLADHISYHEKYLREGALRSREAVARRPSLLPSETTAVNKIVASPFAVSATQTF